MKLSIALPGLLWPDNGDLEYLTRQIVAPNLERLIKYAAVSQVSHNFSDLIYSSYTATTNSLATEMAKSLGYQDLYPYFLMAEPTYLRADRDRLLICESELLQLNDDEVSTIINTLNNHFVGVLQLFPINPNLWLIGLNLDIKDHQFYPILDIIGENIDDYLPNNSIQLTKLLNEIQMLLFSMELNLLRKSEGLLQINSLWLWDKTINHHLTNKYSNIFTNSQSINSVKIKRLPELLSGAFIDNSLIIIDNLYYPCCYRDSRSYLHNLSVVDDQVIAPLLQYRTKIDTLEILIPRTHNTLVITLNKNDKYKFWKNLTFKQVLKEQNAL